MALPKKLGRGLFVGIALAMLVYIAMLLWADVGKVGEALATRRMLWIVPAACGLSFLNYVVRFWKWQRYCKLLEIELETSTSFLIYLSGLALSVTPGKMGEVFKSWLVRKVTGVRIHHSAPIVVAERFTDLLGYLILVAIGGALSTEYATLCWTMLGVCAVMIVLAGSPSFARFVVARIASIKFTSRLAPRIEGAFASTRVLLAPREIVLPTLVSVIGWGCECTGFWLVANAVVPDSMPYLYSVFAFAFSAVVGALTMLPGGLGATEFSLGKLVRIQYSATGLVEKIAQQKATGAIIVARLCTLWFAVLVGIAALALFTKRFGTVEETPDAEFDPGSAP
jgi:uncharacterized protein (TIRG00374 family)